MLNSIRQCVVVNKGGEGAIKVTVVTCGTIPAVNKLLPVISKAFNISPGFISEGKNVKCF